MTESPADNWPAIGFLGAGRLARGLSLAMSKAGVPVVAVASRSQQSASELAAALPGCEVLENPQALADRAELVFVTVPDDHIEKACAALQWRQGQSVVHCSGATEISALASARAQGALVGGFHPLQTFTDACLSARVLAGSTITIEAGVPLAGVLKRLADVMSCRVIELPAGARTRYHAGAVYWAGFVVSLMNESVGLWSSIGVSEDDTRAALLPLLLGTVEATRVHGLVGGVAGPISRGDLKVLERHLADLSVAGPQAVELYCLLALRQLPLLLRRGAPAASVIDQMRALFERTLRALREDGAAFGRRTDLD